MTKVYNFGQGICILTRKLFDLRGDYMEDVLMVSSNEEERAVLWDLKRAGMDATDISVVVNRFRRLYKEKHDIEYLTHYSGEVLFLETERYNQARAEKFAKYVHINFPRSRATRIGEIIKQYEKDLESYYGNKR